MVLLVLLQANILLVATLGVYPLSRPEHGGRTFFGMSCCMFRKMEISQRFGCKSSVNDSEEGIRSIVSVALNTCAHAVGDCEDGTICHLVSLTDRQKKRKEGTYKQDKRGCV